MIFIFEGLKDFGKLSDHVNQLNIFELSVEPEKIALAY